MLLAKLIIGQWVGSVSEYISITLINGIEILCNVFCGKVMGVVSA